MNDPVTITDVARYLGISKTTVSHALSGKRRVSGKVRQQVSRAIEELGYRPNFAALAMNTRRTGLIGVIVENLDSTHTTALLKELSGEFANHSLQMVLGVPNQLNDGRTLLEKFSNGMVDGILNSIAGIDEDEAVKLTHGVPVITYQRHRESPLMIDFEAGTNKALDYLEGLGHRKIAIIPAGQRGSNGEADPCLLAYLKRYKNSGLVFQAPISTIEAGYRIAEPLFAGDATAVLAANDSVAAGVIQWAVEHEIRVPERMSIIGHDDSPLASMTSPSLTSLRLPIDLIAAHTVQALMHAVDPDESKPEALRIVPELIVRHSAQSI